MHNVVVIYYHEVVGDSEGYSYQKIGKTKFDEQMKYLCNRGYQSITFADLEKPLPSKAVIVSFDDGFRSVYENAWPIMKRYGIKGNVYLPTAFIGNNQKFISWDMVREMYGSGDWYFAAHTSNHIDIRLLNDKNMEAEIVDSNETIKKELGYIPEAFCMPFGGYSMSSVKSVRRIGHYKYLLNSCYGRVNERALKRNVIPRIGISDTDTLEVFRQKLNGGYDWKGVLQRFRMLLFNIKGQRFEEYEY